MDSGQTLHSALAGPGGRLAILCVDAMAAATALHVAFWLHFDGMLPLVYAAAFPAALAWLVAIRVASNCALRLHHWSYRRPRAPDALRVGAAAVAGTIAFSFVCLTILAVELPWTLYALELVVASVAFVAVRFTPSITVRWIAAHRAALASPGTSRRPWGRRRR